MVRAKVRQEVPVMTGPKLATHQGKLVALVALHARRQASSAKEPNTSRHRAGDSMRFYCIACGGLADVVSETYTTPPKRLCDECQALKDLDWLE